jgi:dTDP-4-amino-4,6-dideoxygalactose transaminase
MIKKIINISQPIIGKEEIKAVVNVLKSGMIAQGEKVAEFEQNFAQFCGTKYAVAVSNGTAALHSALYACGIKEGDEVITSPFTFVATANSILMQGAKPVFADINPLTFQINAAEIEKKITPKTKAILPVDLYGQVYDAEKINALAKKHNLKIIEDACQAHGAEFNGRKAGSFANAGCFSFYATKNMATGEGGMVTTNDENIAGAIKMFRHHGQSGKARYEYFDLGYNYRLTNIAAAIGLEQLKKIEDFNRKRIKNAIMLSEGLKNIKGIITPTVEENYKHVFHQYTIRVTEDFKMKRDDLIQYLKGQGIGSAIFYPKPLHLHSYFVKMGYKAGDFPIAEKISEEVLSLPVNPLVSEKNIEYIVETIRKI